MIACPLWGWAVKDTKGLLLTRVAEPAIMYIDGSRGSAATGKSR